MPLNSQSPESTINMSKEQLFHIGVKALIKNDSNKILLLKVDQTNFKVKRREDYWDIPGGRIQKGDSILGTLAKELKEDRHNRIHNPKII